MIKLKEIYLKVGNFSLENFSLEVRDGEYYILLGPSGVGKTVLLETIAGFHKAGSGTIEINGVDATEELPENRMVGYIPQGALLLPHLNVLENILFGVKVKKMPESSYLEFLDYLIDTLEISGILSQYPHTLSGGEKQRVAIARSLITKPKTILLDEPLSALDMPIKKKLISALKKIHNGTKMTFLHVTHDQEEAFILGSVITLMFEGKIEQTGKKNRIYFFPKTINVANFTGMQNIYKGKVAEINENERVISILSNGYTFVAEIPSFQELPQNGSEVFFGIRAEEIMLIRERDDLKSAVRENIIIGDIVEVQEKTSTHSLFFKDISGKLDIEIEIPNHVYRRLTPSAGMPVKISLKKDSISIFGNA